MNKPHIPSLNIFPAIGNIMKKEAAGGICMIIFAVIALIVANSVYAEWYFSLLEKKVFFGFGEKTSTIKFKDFIKDAIMIIFFLNVGLELKMDMSKEIAEQKRQILLPIIAAASGMLVPAFIYVGININSPETIKGWAIPSATDIAFAVAILLIVGKKIPKSAKTFLLAIAIFDDLGAIIIIALFYSVQINMEAFGWVLVGIFILYGLSRHNIPNKTPYVLTGIYLAIALHMAGIHSTIAGVLIGVFLPLENKNDCSRSPAEEMKSFIDPWVSFLILPIFAFVSAGISLEGISLKSFLTPVTLGVMAGLFFGKQIGIFCSTYLMVKTQFLKMPKGTTLTHIYGVSIIAGIGFTMSLFITMLAFDDIRSQNEATLGILAASVLAATWGYIYLHFMAAPHRKKQLKG